MILQESNTSKAHPMSNRPPISWNSALRTLNDDRTQVAPGVRTARSLIDGMARIRRTALVTPTGAFGRAAIMAAAVEAAKAHQRRHGSTWAAAMSVGLTAAWASARAARAVAKH
jgi:hypothetical protein